MDPRLAQLIQQFMQQQQRLPGQLGAGQKPMQPQPQQGQPAMNPMQRPQAQYNGGNWGMDPYARMGVTGRPQPQMQPRLQQALGGR